MQDEIRAIVAANIASGLLAKHGVDHGGLKPAEIASRALAIGDEILDQIYLDQVEKLHVPRFHEQPAPPAPAPPAPLGDSGDATRVDDPAAAD